MNPKTRRMAAIRNIIDSEIISSQDELLFRLKDMGIDITQSTLSRDMKFMNVAKVPHRERGYMYMIPDSTALHHNDRGVSSVITDNILSINFSGNIGVIHTKAGYANAVTVLIDDKNMPEILGTIAGDDTIFMVLRENANHQTIIASLRTIHPDIETLYK